MANKFTNMIYSVVNMIGKEPIYTTWITFQLGAGNSPIVFNTDTTNPTQNLIATLTFNKKGAGVTNDFEIVIQYDPFRMGQETTDIVEKLDEYVAKAMSMNYNTDTDVLKGIIQYGYNSTSDSNLVSPKYSFLIKSASSEVQYSSGLASYTFTGVSTIATDCDNAVSFGRIDNWKLMDIILWVLFYWYGDDAHRPAHIDSKDKCKENDFKYRIDIPETVYQEAVENVSVEPMSGMTPWEYCKSLLEEYPLTKAETQQTVYEDLSQLPYHQRPRYEMSLTDVDGVKTIHIAHIKPAAPTVEENGKEVTAPVEASDIQIPYQFSWGTQTKNIVVGWNPKVDLTTYLIRKARYKRFKDDLESAGGDEEAKAKIKEKMTSVDESVDEYYDAQLQLLGIPCDVPIGAELRIVPVVLESISRTAGIYSVKSCTDVISSNGLYVTTIDLFRVRSLDDATIVYKYVEPEVATDVFTSTVTNTGTTTNSSTK